MKHLGQVVATGQRPHREEDLLRRCFRYRSNAYPRASDFTGILRELPQRSDLPLGEDHYPRSYPPGLWRCYPKPPTVVLLTRGKMRGDESLDHRPVKPHQNLPSPADSPCAFVHRVSIACLAPRISNSSPRVVSNGIEMEGPLTNAPRPSMTSAP